MYYQLETILSLVKEDLRGPITFKNSCFPTGLSLARRNLNKVQQYMEKHFGELASDYKKYVDLFKESYRVLCTDVVPEAHVDMRVPSSVYKMKNRTLYFSEKLISDSESLPDRPEWQDSYPVYKMRSFSI